MCYALVLGMEEGSSILILLNIDHLTNIHVVSQNSSQTVFLLIHHVVI